MFQSLRVRFALSHVLPVVLLMPLLSLILLYLLQTRYFLDTLTEELVVQAQMLASVMGQDRTFWQDQAAAQRSLASVGAAMTARVMYIDAQGRIFAATPGSSVRGGDPVSLDIVDRALQGVTAWQTRYSTNMQDNVVDVAVPIRDDRGQLVGVVRLSQSLGAVQSRLQLLTWYIVFVFALGILAALALALFLARTLGIPLIRLTDAVDELQVDQTPVPIAESGPAELRRLAASFNRMASNLAEQTLLRRRMLASIVHEMSRPLGGISAAAQYLMRNSDTAPPELVHELSADIVEQSQQMTRQIDDLTLFSQALSEEIELHLEPTSLVEVCEEGVRHIRPFAEAKSVGIRFEADPSTPVVRADRVRLAQIVANLLNNAVKFSPEGGSIDLAVYPCTDEENRRAAALSVRDGGPGIPLDDQASIFQYFYRGPEQRPLQQGMGLGLAVASRLAKAHGGNLWVQSTPGAGATFFLRLPTEPSAPADPQPN